MALQGGTLGHYGWMGVHGIMGTMPEGRKRGVSLTGVACLGAGRYPARGLVSEYLMPK